MAGHWSVVIVLGTFLIALAVFHVPIVWVRRKHAGVVPRPAQWKWWWEASDYLSVGLAGIALIPAAMEFSRASTTSAFREALPRVHPSMGLYTCESNHRLFTERAEDWKNSKPALEWWAKATEIYKRAEKIKMEGVEHLRSGRHSEADRKFSDTLKIYDELRGFCSRPYDSSIPYADDHRRVLEQIDRDAEAVRTIQDLGNRMSKSDAELIAGLFSPWCLCVALAVRIAKASSKVLVKEAK